MDLDRRAMAGVLSLLLCWGTGGAEQRRRFSHHRRSPAAAPRAAVDQTLTFLPSALLHVGVAGYHDNLDHEAVATLPDHVDDLPVTNLHHVLTIDLGQSQIYSEV